MKSHGEKQLYLTKLQDQLEMRYDSQPHLMNLVDSSPLVKNSNLKMVGLCIG